jgi:hypothetical protein
MCKPIASTRVLMKLGSILYLVAPCTSLRVWYNNGARFKSLTILRTVLAQIFSIMFAVGVILASGAVFLALTFFALRS